ncbi:MAG: hypothetical protein ABIE47_12965 [Pseudomonadota bacterium]
MGEELKVGEKVRDLYASQEGEICYVYSDGWLLIRMEDGAVRYSDPRDVERIGADSGVGISFYIRK